jgi:hypothetical protein
MNSAKNNSTDAYFDFDLIRGTFSNLKKKRREKEKKKRKRRRKSNLLYPPFCMHGSKKKNSPAFQDQKRILILRSHENGRKSEQPSWDSRHCELQDSTLQNLLAHG